MTNATAFCLESQYEPNAINQEGEEKPILEAGDTYDTTTVYQIHFLRSYFIAILENNANNSAPQA